RSADSPRRATPPWCRRGRPRRAAPDASRRQAPPRRRHRRLQAANPPRKVGRNARLISETLEEPVRQGKSAASQSPAVVSTPQRRKSTVDDVCPTTPFHASARVCAKENRRVKQSNPPSQNTMDSAAWHAPRKKKGRKPYESRTGP